jgi:S-disulfanyl-L-cysteine oxidoreductase SoxD
MGMYKMRCSRKVAIPQMVLAVAVSCSTAVAQAPDFNNIGRPPTDQEIRTWDIGIGVEGKELPPGSGTARQGAQIYATKCAACHGKNLEGAKLVPEAPPERTALAGGKGTLKNINPVKSIGSWWPFATTVWDYINRAMPRGQEGSLKADEVYAVTAFILYKNDIIQENDVINAKTLPKVQMPNRNGFIPARFEDIPDLEKRGCRLGHCP